MPVCRSLSQQSGLQGEILIAIKGSVVRARLGLSTAQQNSRPPKAEAGLSLTLATALRPSLHNTNKRLRCMALPLSLGPLLAAAAELAQVKRWKLRYRYTDILALVPLVISTISCQNPESWFCWTSITLNLSTCIAGRRIAYINTMLICKIGKEAHVAYTYY